LQSDRPEGHGTSTWPLVSEAVTVMAVGKLVRRLERLEAELAPEEPEDKVTVTLVSDKDHPCRTYEIHLPEPKPRRRGWSRYRGRGRR